MKISIYRHLNTLNGKSYIGQTCRKPTRRWKAHIWQAKSGCKYLFHKAIRKFGPPAFSMEILEICETRELANQAERKWISFFKSDSDGYNLNAGGDSHNSHSETRQKIKTARIAYWEKIPTEEKSRRGALASSALSREERRRLTLSHWASLTRDERQKQVDRLNAARTTKQRSETMKAIAARRTPEQKALIEKKRMAALTPERRREICLKGAATIGRERRIEIGRKSAAALGPEKLRARAIKALAARTPQQRSEAMKRAWITRKKNQGLQYSAQFCAN